MLPKTILGLGMHVVGYGSYVDIYTFLAFIYSHFLRK